MVSGWPMGEASRGWILPWLLGHPPAWAPKSVRQEVPVMGGQEVERGMHSAQSRTGSTHCHRDGHMEGHRGPQCQHLCHLQLAAPSQPAPCHWHLHDPLHAAPAAALQHWYLCHCITSTCIISTSITGTHVTHIINICVPGTHSCSTCVTCTCITRIIHT